MSVTVWSCNGLKKETYVLSCTCLRQSWTMNEWLYCLTQHVTFELRHLVKCLWIWYLHDCIGSRFPSSNSSSCCSWWIGDWIVYWPIIGPLYKIASFRCRSLHFYHCEAYISLYDHSVPSFDGHVYQDNAPCCRTPIISNCFCLFSPDLSPTKVWWKGQQLLCDAANMINIKSSPSSWEIRQIWRQKEGTGQSSQIVCILMVKNHRIYIWVNLQYVSVRWCEGFDNLKPCLSATSVINNAKKHSFWYQLKLNNC